MMKLSRRGLLAAGGAALALPFLGKGARAATVLRYGHMHTPASIAGAQAEWFAAAVREKTGGAIEIQIFPNSQLGKLQELAEAVSTGSIAFSHNTAGAVATRMKSPTRKRAATSMRVAKAEPSGHLRWSRGRAGR